MCEFDWHLALEYLKVLLSWPVIALIIAFIFFTPISSVILRIRKGTLFGNNFEVAPQEQIPRGEKDLLTMASEENVLRAKTPVKLSVMAPEEEYAILATPEAGATPETGVEPLPPELQGDPSAQLVTDWVRKNPAHIVVEYRKLVNNLNFERLFNQIYGTQIALLDYLGSIPEHTATLTQLSQFYLHYLSKPGAISSYSQHSYMSFLVAFNVLAETDVPPQGKTYTLTKFGIDFLSYIKTNYPFLWNQKAF